MMYILENKIPVPAQSNDDYGQWFNTPGNRRVAETTVGDSVVSTVFLGIDHRFGETHQPQFFETMIFGGVRHEEMYRYATWDEAEAGHWGVVELLRYERAKKLRTQGLKYFQIAERIGVSRGSVSYLINKNFEPSVKLYTKYSLTFGELETVKLLALGHSNYVIGDLLKVSCKTIESRIQRIYRKLGIENNRYICKRNVAANMLREYFDLVTELSQ